MRIKINYKINIYIYIYRYLRKIKNLQMRNELKETNVLIFNQVNNTNYWRYQICSLPLKGEFKHEQGLLPAECLRPPASLLG